jgi:outer membrane protein OmpA-like peptidoglycan-associated protein
MSRIELPLGLMAAALPFALASSWVVSANGRLAAAEASPEVQQAVAVAQADERGYCSPELKAVLRRVLTSCGLVGADGTAGRGCQPANAKSVSTMDGADFNALFMPLASRAAIIEFDQSDSQLDDLDKALVDRVFAARGGASYFLVVARASPEGSAAANSALSELRGRAVMDHLSATFQDPELDRQVGLLWLGEEYAQLDADFCTWNRSGGGDCDPQAINRSAFLAWIDCRI